MKRYRLTKKRKAALERIGMVLLQAALPAAIWALAIWGWSTGRMM